MIPPAVQSIVALVALASYLAAACLDCESVAPAPGDFAARMATMNSMASHGLESSPASSVAEPAARGHDHASGHGEAHAGGHSGTHAGGHSAGHAHMRGHAEAETDAHDHARAHAHADGHGDPSAHAASDPAARRVPRAIRAASDFAEWKATCTCGCGETRAQIGGNLSRLGSVVPGTHVSWLPEAVHARGPGPQAPTPIDVFTTLDPVPI